MVLAAEKRVIPPLLAMDAAIAEGVAEGHQDLAVPGITVVPGNPEVCPGDAETFECSVGAVRTGHVVDQRRRSPCDPGRRWRWHRVGLRGYLVSIRGRLVGRGGGDRRRRGPRPAVWREFFVD